MTPAEEKVREISDKLVTRIDELRDEGYTEASILATVRNYLIGITDGIDFAEEMRNHDEQSQLAPTIMKHYQEPADEVPDLFQDADTNKEMQDQQKAFANEWMNNGCQEPDQDIT